MMLTILLKLGLAVVLGGAIGLEREFSQKPAGLRTNILICVGSTMMMALSGLILAGANPGQADALRVAAGVITGMGFIGAGSIIRSGVHVHGLTTASTLWAVTGLGLVIGAGEYSVSLAYTAFVVATLVIFRKVEGLLPRREVVHYVLRARGADILDGLRAAAAAQKVRLEEVSYRREGAESALVGFRLMATLDKARQFRSRIEPLGEIVEVRFDQ
jgi:putative Mg2+ transporter-C (MgtC) family protein